MTARHARLGRFGAAMPWLAVVLLVFVAADARAQRAPDETMPDPLREVGFEQKIGEDIPEGIAFVDENGREVTLQSYLGERPVVLALVYYECPMICNMVLNGLVRSLDVLEFSPGEEFEVVVVSFDPTEGPALAHEKKANYMELYGRPETADSWHFLTGEQDAIDRLTETVGFRYVWDERTSQYAHATGVTVITPKGQIARYLFGIEYAPKDLRLALVEAGENELGTVVDQLLLYCFQYDPTTGKYGAAVINLIRLGGALTVAAMVTFFVVMRRRERREQAVRRELAVTAEPMRPGGAS